MDFYVFKQTFVHFYVGVLSQNKHETAMQKKTQPTSLRPPRDCL